MATGFGLAPDAKGNGTTAEDIQRIIGATYRYEGIISGVAVAGMAGKMAWQVMEGAVIMNFGTNMKLAVPVPRVEVPTEPNPGTTARREKVYVQQRTVATDGDNLVVVRTTTGTLPARSILLADYEIPAGATTTAGATDRANRIYTRPVGGQYGVLHRTTDVDSTPRAGELVTRGQGRIGVLPTERDVTLHMASCISSSGAGTEGSVLYKFYVDDLLVGSWERVFNQYWETKSFELPLVLQATSHTFKYTVQRRSGTVGWAVRGGGAEKFPGDVFRVMDNGVATL